MNHSPSGSLLLSKAIPGFINYKTAEGLALTHDRLSRATAQQMARTHWGSGDR